MEGYGSIAVPERIAGYTILREIGHGGMSSVYLAEHDHLRRRVAIKVLAPALAASPTFRERFARESQVVAALDHPHIVPIFDAGEAHGLFYIVMRYVEHRDLRGMLTDTGPLSTRRTVTLVEQLGDALDEAHAAGVVHRDIKPANILMAIGRRGEDHCYLSDFGITKRAASGPSLTSTGQVLGTVDYIAPEQIEGRPVDRRTDVYALGALIFECLTGVVPFVRDHQLAVLLAHVREPPPRPTSLVPGLPSGIDDVVARAMAKEPAERPSTASELAGLVAEALDGRTVRPTFVPSPRPRRTTPGPLVPPGPTGDVNEAGATERESSGPLPGRAAARDAVPITVAPSLPSGGELLDPSAQPTESLARPAALAGVDTAQIPPSSQRAASPAGPSPARGRRLVVATVVALVAVVSLVAAVVATTRADDADASAAAPNGSATAAEAPDELTPVASPSEVATSEPIAEPEPAVVAAELLRSVLPPEFQGCEPVPTTGPALARVDCPGAVSLTYEAFSDPVAANTAWESRAAAAGAHSGRCGVNAQPHTDSYHRADPAVAAGRLLCTQPPDGAHLVWTQDDMPTIVAELVLPGGAQMHHEAYDRWAADEFGPRTAGVAVPRGGCATAAC